MKKKVISLFILVAVCACVSIGAKNGCTTTERTIAGTGIGSGVGAALGAGIGALTGSPSLGALIGAGAGALGGGLIGAMTDSQGNQLTEEEMREARLQALEMEGQYDPDLYALRIDRDANDNIRVVPYLKPAQQKKLELTN